MKIWFDILTPKQILFLGSLADYLKKKGFKLFLTSRNYREAIELAEMKDLDIRRVGRHGGNSLEGKLLYSCYRTTKLAKMINKKEIDLLVSFSSVEAARVAFGLSIPHLCISDSPHAEAVSRLTIPLASTLYSPWIIPKKAWISYGIDDNSIFHYQALDPAAWLKTHTPNPAILEELQITLEQPIIVFRPSEIQAAYMMMTSKSSPIPTVIEQCLKKNIDAEILVLPRYREQYLFYKKRFSKKVKVIQKVIDVTSLLTYTTIFIGAGGTMTCEAALLGVPTLSCYPSAPTYVELFLIKSELVQRSLDPQTIINFIYSYLHDETSRKKLAAKATQLLSSMDNPVTILANAVTRHLSVDH